MKSIYISLLFCGLFISAIHGQELFIHGGKSVTNFQFKDVLSIELQGLQSTNHSYIDVGYRGKLFTEAINWVGELGVHTYGSIGNDTFGNYLAWETTYAGLAVGIDAELFKINRFAFHLRGTVGPELMLQGTQVLNNQVFDVLNEQDFDTPFVFIKGAASFEYSATDTIALFCQYRFSRGSQINSNESGADLGYNSNDFGIGVILQLKKKDEEDANNTSGTK
jgi:hypothetical protein